MFHLGMRILLLYFYPRPPRGGRHVASAFFVKRGSISIHALREEGDRRCLQSRAVGRWISIHALREEGDGEQVK